MSLSHIPLTHPLFRQLSRAVLCYGTEWIETEWDIEKETGRRRRIGVERTESCVLHVWVVVTILLPPILAIGIIIPLNNFWNDVNRSRSKCDGEMERMIVAVVVVVEGRMSDSSQMHFKRSKKVRLLMSEGERVIYIFILFALRFFLDIAHSPSPPPLFCSFCPFSPPNNNVISDIHQIRG